MRNLSQPLCEQGSLRVSWVTRASTGRSMDRAGHLDDEARTISTRVNLLTAQLDDPVLHRPVLGRVVKLESHSVDLRTTLAQPVNTIGTVAAQRMNLSAPPGPESHLLGRSNERIRAMMEAFDALSKRHAEVTVLRLHTKELWRMRADAKRCSFIGRSGARGVDYEP